MKIVILGDVHINEDMPYANKNNNRLITELLPAFEEMFRYIRKKNIYYVAITGDFFDSIKINPTEFGILQAFLGLAMEARVKKIIAVLGQHELDETGNSILREISRSSNLIVAKNKPWIFKTGHDKQTSFHMVNYHATTSGFKKDIEHLLENDKDSEQKVLLAHQAVKGCKWKTISATTGLPESMFADSGLIGKNYRFCWFGDFHRHQPLPNGKGLYTGCFTQKHYGDEGFPASFFVFDTVKIAYERILVNAPVFQTITIKENTNIDYSNLFTEGYIRIILHGSREFVTTFDMESLKQQIIKKLKPKHICKGVSILDEKSEDDREKISPRKYTDEELIARTTDMANDPRFPQKMLYEKGIRYLKQAKEKQT